MSESARPPRLTPTFLIIGAQRAGTTSLYHYLGAHPLVAPAATKELHFFDIHFARGAGWYWEQFPPEVGAVTGEATPYYLFHPLAPQRIAALLPGVKLVVLLRNPIDRAQSHHQHECRRGKESLAFAEALAAESARLHGEAERIIGEPGYRSTPHQWHSYRSRGCYMDQIEQWLPHFPRANFLFLRSERFFSDPSATLRRVTDFLALPSLPAKEPARYEKYNLASYGPMPPRLREELADFYRGHNARLAAFLNEDLGWDG